MTCVLFAYVLPIIHFLKVLFFYFRVFFSVELGLEWEGKSEQCRSLRSVEQCLRSYAAILYSLGFCNTTLFQAKFYIQKICKSKSSWDKELSAALVTEWKKLFPE